MSITQDSIQRCNQIKRDGLSGIRCYQSEAGSFLHFGHQPLLVLLQIISLTDLVSTRKRIFDALRMASKSVNIGDRTAAWTVCLVDLLDAVLIPGKQFSHALLLSWHTERSPANAPYRLLGTAIRRHRTLSC